MPLPHEGHAQLGTLSQFTPSGGTFGAYFGNLKRHGMIEEANGKVQITRAGLDFLGTDVPPHPQTTAELLELWRGASAPATPPAAGRLGRTWGRSGAMG